MIRLQRAMFFALSYDLAGGDRLANSGRVSAHSSNCRIHSAGLVYPHGDATNTFRWNQPSSIHGPPRSATTSVSSFNHHGVVLFAGTTVSAVSIFSRCVPGQ